MESIERLAVFMRFVGLAGILLCSISACSTGPVKESTTVATNTQSTGGAMEQAYASGLAAMEEGKHELAERAFLKLVADYPTVAGSYSNLAIIYLKAAKYEDALGFASKAIALDADLAESYNVRAQAEIKLGKIKEAESDYLKAVELRPNYVTAQYNLALLYDIYYQDIDRAIKHYEIYLSVLEQPDEATREWVKRLKGSLKNG